MKKLSILFMILFACTAIKAQFTITTSDAPEIGDRFVFYSADTTGVQAGSAGNGITWDYSNLVALNDSNVQTFVNPSSTPYAADFPDANQAQDESDGNYNYFKLGSDGYYYYGAVINTGQEVVKYKYTDAAKYYKFPYSYGESYTDNLAAGYVAGGLTFNRTGTFDGSYDGFGTLKLPGGVFTNVARAKLVENNTDVASIGGFTVTVKTTITTYIWKQQGRDQALLNISFIKTEPTTGPPTLSKVVTFSKATSSGAGISDNAPDMSVGIYPNPVTDQLVINAHKHIQGVSIYHLNGQEIMSFAGNSTTLKADVSSLTKGIVLVKITLADGSSEFKKLVVE